LALRQRQQRELHQLMQGYLTPLTQEPAAQRSAAEAMVRTLQGSAARHGELLEGLLPPLRAFETLLAVQQPREEQVNGLFTDAIDLFADSAQETDEIWQPTDKARLAHHVWVNHLRQWSRDEAVASRLGLDNAVLQQISDVLVIASYRLNLLAQLKKIVDTDKSSAAQLHGLAMPRRLLLIVQPAASARGSRYL